MSFYARPSWRLLRQVSADVSVVVWTIVWWLVARGIHASVSALATPSREVARATEELQNRLRDGAAQVDGLPLLGDQLRQPFDGAATGLADVVAAANSQVTSIEQLAQILGVVVFVLPVSLVLVAWLPARLRFFATARAARRFIDSSADLDLFALRAMANQPMHVLARISDDPVADWRAGNRTVIDRLAAVELDRAGLSMPKRR